MLDNNEKIESLMKNAMCKLKDIIDVNTVVGTPLFLEDGTMIVPITKVAMGFVAGGGEYSQNIPPKNAQKEYPFAGGSTAGFSVTPVGFLIGKSGNLKLVSVDNQSKFEEVCKLFKDISKNLKKWGGYEQKNMGIGFVPDASNYSVFYEFDFSKNSAMHLDCW